MSRLRILIVEDEIIIARDIEEQLKSFGYQVTAIAKNSKTAIAAFNQEQPDLVLMDIILNNSEFDGIQIAQIFNNLKRVPIIYLTSSDSQKLYERAKTTVPINYLYKPCNEKQLKAAVELAFQNFSSQQDSSLYSVQSQAQPQSLFANQNCIFIRDKERFIKINVEDILWVEAANAYVNVHTSNEKFLTTGNLKNFLIQVHHPALERVHRSFAANLSKIHAFDGGNLYIKKQEKDHRIPVAPKSRDEIFSRFLKLKTRL